MSDLNKNGVDADAPHQHRGGKHPHDKDKASAHAALNETVPGTTDQDVSPTNANPATTSVSAGAPASARGSNPVPGPVEAVADTARTNGAGTQPIQSPASEETDGE